MPSSGVRKRWASVWPVHVFLARSPRSVCRDIDANGFLEKRWPEWFRQQPVMGCEVFPQPTDDVGTFHGKIHAFGRVGREVEQPDPRGMAGNLELPIAVSYRLIAA